MIKVRFLLYRASIDTEPLTQQAANPAAGMSHGPDPDPIDDFLVAMRRDKNDLVAGTNQAPALAKENAVIEGRMKGG